MVEERRQNKSRDIEDGSMFNKRMKDKIMYRDRRQLVHQHPNDLLRLLTCGQDRQTTARCRLDRTSSFAISSNGTFHLLDVRYMMRMHIPSIMLGYGCYSILSVAQ